MSLADEFRNNAKECAEKAKQARTAEDRVHWLSMAQWWHRLAEHAQDQDAVQEQIPSDNHEGNGNTDDEEPRS